MALVDTGHHHFHLHALDSISRKTWLTWLRNATALMCLMALAAAMWMGGSLSALMHTPLMSGILSLDAVMIPACTSIALSLVGLVGAGSFQFRTEQVNTPVT